MKPLGRKRTESTKLDGIQSDCASAPINNGSSLEVRFGCVISMPMHLPSVCADSTAVVLRVVPDCGPARFCEQVSCPGVDMMIGGSVVAVCVPLALVGGHFAGFVGLNGVVAFDSAFHFIVRHFTLCPRPLDTHFRCKSRSPVRPVLKHGPRSLTCARVIGWQTDWRNESEHMGSWYCTVLYCTGRTVTPFQLLSSSGAAEERTRWDPKDGELCLSRMKPEETLVEVRSGSDVQIDRQTWV